MLEALLLRARWHINQYPQWLKLPLLNGGYYCKYRFSLTRARFYTVGIHFNFNSSHSSRSVESDLLVVSFMGWRTNMFFVHSKSVVHNAGQKNVETKAWHWQMCASTSQNLLPRDFLKFGRIRASLCYLGVKRQFMLGNLSPCHLLHV